MKALWNNTLIAESDKTIEVEGNHFFPPEAIISEYFQLSDTHTVSSEHGKASYFNLQVGDEKIPDAAWFYPHPEPQAAEIKNHIAFKNGVELKK